MSPFLRLPSLRLFRSLALGVLVTATCAASKFDLERITPVPADQPIPVMDFFRPLLLQEPKINPSGTHIAAIITAAEDKHRLLVYELKTQKMEFVGGIGDQDIYQVHWLNDQRLIFGLARGKMYGIGLLAGAVGLLQGSYPLVQYYNTRLIAIPRKNRLEPLVWNRYDGLDHRQDLGAATLDSASRRLARIYDFDRVGARGSDVSDCRDSNESHIKANYPIPEGGLTYEYMADREGQLAFAFTAQDGCLTMHRLAGNQWIKCPVDLEEIDVVGAGDQPGQVLVVGPRQEAKPRALQLMDAATGQLGDVVLQDEAYDFDGWLYHDPATQAILGAVFQRNGPRVVWFDEGYRNLQKILDGFFPGLVVRIIGSNEEQNFFLVSTFSDRQPRIYSWVDLEKRTTGVFKNSAPWIDPQRMQPQNIIKFKTRDGRQLDAYLTLPAGASKKNPAPLVVLPHGGPWVRDNWDFDREAQFLASRGYAVLKPNYRGSTGYDWKFPVEDRWDFRKMHDDVTDATKTMIASGLIDKGRIAIMGTSFGGYLAISGVVNEPTLYRCAVTVAGVFDWEQQIKDKKIDQYDSPAFGWLMLKLGDPKKQPEKFDAISPGRHVDKIRVPVFVSAGKDDYTVDYEQTSTLLSALTKYNVPHEKFVLREEGHGMHHLENEAELYTRIEAFLDKNLKPAPAVAATP